MADRCKIRFEAPIEIGTGNIVGRSANGRIQYDGFDMAALANETGALGYFAQFENMPGQYFVLDVVLLLTNETAYKQGNEAANFINILSEAIPCFYPYAYPLSAQVAGIHIHPIAMLPYQGSVQLDYSIALTEEDVPIGSRVTFYSNPPFLKAGRYLGSATLKAVDGNENPPTAASWPISEFNPGDPGGEDVPHFLIIEGTIYIVGSWGNVLLWNAGVDGDVAAVYLEKIKQQFPYFPASPNTMVEQYSDLMGKQAYFWQSYPS